MESFSFAILTMPHLFEEMRKERIHETNGQSKSFHWRISGHLSSTQQSKIIHLSGPSKKEPLSIYVHLLPPVDYSRHGSQHEFLVEEEQGEIDGRNFRLVAKLWRPIPTHDLRIQEELVKHVNNFLKNKIQ